MKTRAKRLAHQGFTLVEVLVALAILAVMAVMAWRAIDGLVRTQQGSAEHHRQAEQAQMALLQWQMDLSALATQAHEPALAFDGNSLTLVRRDATERARLRVVAWRVRSGQWSRWQSPALTQVRDVERAWTQAQSWGQGQWESPARLDLLTADDWAIYYFRDNAWSNPLSTAASEKDANTNALPSGIRLRLQRSSAGAFSGELSWDWVSPLGVPKS